MKGRVTYSKAVSFGVCLVGAAAGALAAAGCDNSPYPASDREEAVYYSSFSLEPKHLDPARAYSTWDGRLLGQCLEAPFQYHYLKRPYELTPLTAEDIPKPEQRTVTFGGRQVEATVYTIRVKRGILYQNHACFVEHNRRLTESDVQGVRSLADIKDTATRELTADDYVNTIRRLTDSRLSCPVYPTLAKNLLGMAEYRKHLDTQLKAERARRKDTIGELYNRQANEKRNPIRIDYTAGAEQFPFVRRLDKDRYAFEVVLSRPYPQILYWMAMSFFAPVPTEAVEFYSQPVLLERGITLDKNPVGTGPYKLANYDPSNQIVFERNANFRLERYPDLPIPPESNIKARRHYETLRAAGMLDPRVVDTSLPIIDRIVYSMEKESIPRWNKFLQGYYDTSGIDDDLFDEAVSLTSQGDPNVSEDMQQRGIRLLTDWPMGINYYAFNMTDETVGGYTEKARKLRQAISIAIDVEEYVTVFVNDRGVPAHSPIPPGIFGHEEGPGGMNKVVYARWDAKRRCAIRHDISHARTLLAEAGYPNGYGADGRQLTIQYISGSTSAEGRARQKWIQKQLQKLNIRLAFENTDHNQFQEKVRKGNYQMLHWGWVADYPDPENFLFLLYGPNGKVATGGVNTANYRNAEYDRLFEQMETMTNGPERLRIITEMLAILHKDAPWVFDFHARRYALYHRWCRNAYPHCLAYNSEKYVRLDLAARKAYRDKHNRPVWWPLPVLLLSVVITAVPAVRAAARHFREV